MTDRSLARSDGLIGVWAAAGEMGARMHAHDWSESALGSPLGWSTGLQSAVSICLHSRYPIAIYWGPELSLVYNDAWSPILGEKHPWALGRPALEVWPEIWDRIAPLFARVMMAGEGVWQEDELLPMNRHGYVEECYFNFTFSPILDEAGQVGGVFNAVVETTYRVIGERRSRILRRLAERTGGARSLDEVWRAASAALGEAGADIPFAVLYEIDEPGQAARLRGTAGVEAGSPAAPTRLSLEPDTAAGWPIAEAVQAGAPQAVHGLGERVGRLPGGDWADHPTSALVLPIPGAIPEHPLGVLVAGVSPRRALDDDYIEFFSRVADQIGAAGASARSYDAERRRAEALAELDRAKTTFFSNVSHEFRTPLTLLLGPIEDALADRTTPLPADQRERLELAHRNGLRLLRLVNALLDFARLESGRIAAWFEPTDLTAATSELASAFRSAIERAGLAFEIDIAALDQPVYVDRDMWEKIVLNLLSNALKFTLEGSIAVRLHPVGDGVALEVTDTGIGIPADELPRLFERFHRVEGARGRTQEGTGIGLALVQELVRLHGGDLTADSEPGKGTTFTVRLPTGGAHLPPEQVRTGGAGVARLGAAAFVEEANRWMTRDAMSLGPATVSEFLGDASAPVLGDRAPDAGSPRILLADDNTDMREYLVRLLATRWRVTAVADGEAALESALADPPDLVLSDIMMPRLDGLALLAALRQDPRTREIPIVLLSARAGEEASAEGLDRGADDYLTKPFTARELLARVAAHLAMARIRREALAREVAARAAAEHSSAQLNFALEATRTVAFDWDLSTGRIDCSESAEAVLGRPVGSAEQQRELVHPDDRQQFDDLLQHALATQTSADLEFRVLHPDGSLRWMHLAAAVGRDEAGNALRLTGIQADITERRAAELQAQAAQRMDAVGQLAGGVAHEVNNALTGVLGFGLLALRRLPDDAPVRSDLEQVIQSGERAAAVARQLLAYSRRQVLQPRRIDLVELVRGFEPMLRQTLGPEKDLTLALCPSAWVHADRAQLEQVLLNLVLNARDAMHYGGRLTVSIEPERNLRGSARRALPAGEAPAGAFAVLSVSDTGAGMDRATQARVFEPFFTTKPVGQGTGLGLATVYGIVRQSGGYIWIYSEPGQGTTVRIALPLVSAPSDTVGSPSDREPPPSRRGERLLVVDDEPVVRSVLERVLSGAGYRVTTADSGAAALEALTRGGEPVRLVVSDLVMPGMSGRELAERLSASHPGVRVLFMSGYTNDEGIRRGLLPDGAAFVQKPLNTGRVLEAVHALLAEDPAMS